MVTSVHAAAACISSAVASLLFHFSICANHRVDFVAIVVAKLSARRDIRRREHAHCGSKDRSVILASILQAYWCNVKLTPGHVEVSVVPEHTLHEEIRARPGLRVRFRVRDLELGLGSGT